MLYYWDFKALASWCSRSKAAVGLQRSGPKKTWRLLVSWLPKIKFANYHEHYLYCSILRWKAEGARIVKSRWKKDRWRGLSSITSNHIQPKGRSFTMQIQDSYGYSMLFWCHIAQLKNHMHSDMFWPIWSLYINEFHVTWFEKNTWPLTTQKTLASRQRRVAPRLLEEGAERLVPRCRIRHAVLIDANLHRCGVRQWPLKHWIHGFWRCLTMWGGRIPRNLESEIWKTSHANLFFVMILTWEFWEGFDRVRAAIANFFVPPHRFVNGSAGLTIWAC